MRQSIPMTGQEGHVVKVWRQPAHGRDFIYFQVSPSFRNGSKLNQTQEHQGEETRKLFPVGDITKGKFYCLTPPVMARRRRRNPRIVSPIFNMTKNAEKPKYRCLHCGEVRDSKIELMMHQELWDCGGFSAKRARDVKEKRRATYGRLKKEFEG